MVIVALCRCGLKGCLDHKNLLLWLFHDTSVFVLLGVEPLSITNCDVLKVLRGIRSLGVSRRHFVNPVKIWNELVSSERGSLVSGCRGGRVRVLTDDPGPGVTRPAVTVDSDSRHRHVAPLPEPRLGPHRGSMDPGWVSVRTRHRTLGRFMK